MNWSVRRSSRLTTLFRHRLGLANHRIALSFRNAGPFCPSRRFSAWFGLFGRCAQRYQNGRHTSAHLPGSDHLLPSFPRSKVCLSKLTCQDQLIHGSGHDQTPAFKLLRTADASFGPEEILLEKIAVPLRRNKRPVHSHGARHSSVAFHPLHSRPHEPL